MSNKKELARAIRAEKGSRLQTKACADRISAHLQTPAEERKVVELDAEIVLFEKRLVALENCQSTLIELTDEDSLEDLITDCEEFLVNNTAVLRAAREVSKSDSAHSDNVSTRCATGARLSKIVLPTFSVRQALDCRILCYQHLVVIRPNGLHFGTSFLR